MVLYDDTFATQFKNKAVAEIKKMMSQANGLFKHKGLDVKIQLDTMAIQHAKGKSWNGEFGAQYL